MTSSRRWLVVLSIASLFASRWLLRGEDGPAPVPELRPWSESRLEWDWRCRAVVQRPAVAEFTAGEKKLPVEGRIALLVVAAAGTEPGDLLQAAQELAKPVPLVDVAWVAPDEATAVVLQKSGARGVRGAVVPEVCDLVSPEFRPALLVVAPDRKIAFVHPAGPSWDAQSVADEMAMLRRIADPKSPPVAPPAPTSEFRGALACAACHRSEFADWLLTPHSVAVDELSLLGKDTDPSCLPCHVAGWNQKGGYATPGADRRLSHVQCETCHDPQRTHAGDKRLRREEYAARCRTCHTPSASIAPDITMSIPSVSHQSAAHADKITWEFRDQSIQAFRDSTYFQYCSKTAYVGSESCKSCHESAHKQWGDTPHAGAFETLRKAKKEREAGCVKCHTTGFGHEGGFQDEKSTPAVAHVGCESCHGPGKLHNEAKTRDERLSSIFRFDEKCPTCVVQRICRTCHSSEHDPDFNLSKAIEKIRHGNR